MDSASANISSSAAIPQHGGLVIGVDIGGTKIAAGIVDRAGQIIHEIRTSMISNNGAEPAISAVVSAIESVSREMETGQELFRAIGICSPGPLNPADGIIINPPNLPCWRNFPITADLAKIYPVPVLLDNDGNAAALAEALWGAGRGYRNVFYVTVGTGIGTGIIFDGKIYHGRTGAAGEGGHISIDYRGLRCGCGKRGCIEALAAGPAIGERARAKLEAQKRRESIMLDLAGGEVEAVTSQIVGKAYDAGDCLAQEVLSETVALLSVWLGNIVDLLEPDVIIVGGGVAQMLTPFFPQIRDQLSAWCVNSRCQEIPIILAHYGAHAGVAGAAALCSAFFAPSA